MEQGLAYSRRSICVGMPPPHWTPPSLFFWLFSKFLDWAPIPVPGRDIWAGSSSPHSAIFREGSGLLEARPAGSHNLPVRLGLPACPAPLPASPAAASWMASPSKWGDLGHLSPGCLNAFF